MSQEKIRSLISLILQNDASKAKNALPAMKIEVAQKLELVCWVIDVVIVGTVPCRNISLM